MLTLYYWPGSYSIAARILLEEGGEPYQSHRIDLPMGEQRSPAYLQINSRGTVPALRLDDGEVLTENIAILAFLGKRFRIWPTDPIAEAKALSIIGYLATTVATAHARALHGARFTADPAGIPGVKSAGLEAFHAGLVEIDRMLRGREWISDSYSPCDPYAFGFYSWGLRRELPMRELRHYTAFKDRMLQRPAVRRIAEDERIPT